MLLPGPDGTMMEVENPYYLGRSRGRTKPSASLRRMQAVATPEDRNSDALLPPSRPSSYPPTPWDLSGLKVQLERKGLGDLAELAAAYAINCAIRLWLALRKTDDKTKRRLSTAVLYKGFLCAQLLGREYTPPQSVPNFNPEFLFRSYDVLRNLWVDDGSLCLRGGVAEAWEYIHNKIIPLREKDHSE